MNGNGYIETTGRDGNFSTTAVCELSEHDLRTARVWLVDDNANFRKLLAELLHSEGGFDCERQFSNPADALLALKQGSAPDIILLDIEMGEFCGLDFIRPLKSEAKDTHVLMLTTLAGPGARERAFREGASDFMLKCWAPEKIASRMRQAMELGSVAGLLTAYFSGITLAPPSVSPPKAAAVVAPRMTLAERWITHLRSWWKLSPSEGTEAI